MAGPLTAEQALADLLGVSTQIGRVALCNAEGAVIAEVGGVGANATELWAGADEAARLLGRPTVTQFEIGLPDSLVFGVREGAFSAVAVTDPAATADLVFYDLRAALRSLEGGTDASG